MVVPADIGVTKPLLLIVATEGLDEIQGNEAALVPDPFKLVGDEAFKHVVKFPLIVGKP